MKKLFFIAALAVASFDAQAQDTSPVKFSLGVEAALPVGDFGDVSSFGIGGTVQGDYMAAESLALTLNAGYISFMGKTVNGVKFGSSGFIPVLAGIKYYFTPQLYGSGQLGVTFGDQKGSGSIFTYAPGLGYKFSEDFDGLIKYTGYSQSGGSISTVGVRLAYTF